MLMILQKQMAGKYSNNNTCPNFCGFTRAAAFWNVSSSFKNYHLFATTNPVFCENGNFWHTQTLRFYNNGFFKKYFEL
jgi:hypothetical protein